MATYAPYHVDIAPWMNWKASSTYATMNRTNYSGALGMGYLTAASGGATGQHMEWDVALTAGTWTLTVVYLKSGSFGIVTPSIDGTDLSTLDTYVAGTTYNNVNQWTGINIASDGVKELKFRTDSKNAGSAGYNFYPQWITLTRTGA